VGEVTVLTSAFAGFTGPLCSRKGERMVGEGYKRRGGITSAQLVL